jgi:hypothetical protein
MPQGVDQRGKRTYKARVEVTYLGGSLSDDSVDALTVAVSDALGDTAKEISLGITTKHYDKVALSAIVRGGNSLEAITLLDGTLDDAIFRTGLFEQFDVSGKQLEVAPLEHSL